MRSQLIVPSLGYDVKLGCLDSERALPQKIEIGITIDFNTLPMALESDSIKDTICYAEIAQRLNLVCNKKSYNLIEHLAWCCFSEINEIVDNRGTLRLEIRKLNPPAAHFLGPSIFSIGN